MLFPSGRLLLRWRPFSRPVKPKKKPEAGSDASEAPAAVQVVDSAPVLSSPFQAARLLHAFHVSRETEKIEMTLKLDVDLKRHAVRGVCALPNGLQTDLKLLVFCPDNEAEEMLKAGADFAGVTECVARINKGWLGFDRCIATPAMMPQVLKVAKILGPKKLMPNPKSGNIVDNLKDAIAEAKAGGSVEFRAEGDGTVTVPIGLTSFSEFALLDNIKCFVKELSKQKPRETKKSVSQMADKASVPSFFVVEARIKSQTGPPVGLDPERMQPSSSGYFR